MVRIGGRSNQIEPLIKGPRLFILGGTANARVPAMSDACSVSSRQVRYQAALRPDICCSFDSKPLPQFPILSSLPDRSQKPSDRGKTVPKPHQLGLSVSKPGRSSFAFRFIFCRASRFICSFICEYFLNTFASPCRNNCVTHSSATPPALKRVA